MAHNLVVPSSQNRSGKLKTWPLLSENSFSSGQNHQEVKDHHRPESFISSDGEKEQWNVWNHPVSWWLAQGILPKLFQPHMVLSLAYFWNTHISCNIMSSTNIEFTRSFGWHKGHINTGHIYLSSLDMHLIIIPTQKLVKVQPDTQVL